MTRIISVLNFKGGTGKTTTVVNLGMGLAMRGHRVLAIDLDPQGSVGSWLGITRYQASISEVLLGTAEWPDAVARARVRFDIIPSDRQLADAEHILVEQQASPTLLSRRLPGLSTAGYDFVLLDCAPSINIMSEAALYLSREVFVPVSMEYLALVGAREVIIEVLRARRLMGGQTARVSLVIPSFYYVRHRKSRDTLSMLQDHFPGMVSEPIRASVRLSEAPSHQLTIFEYDPDGPGSEDYARLAEKVAANDRDTSRRSKEKPR
jgi:chromosome partitioning protein